MGINSRKVVVVGCGFVGSSSAFALMQSQLFSEMVLIDADQKRAEGEAIDISHGMVFASPMKIYAGTYDDISDAAVIVITAGANQNSYLYCIERVRVSGKPGHWFGYSSGYRKIQV